MIMKLFNKLMLFATVCTLSFSSCVDEEDYDVTPSKDYVTIQIDYLGSGGYYNDNISGVPYGLVQGSNGPYEFDASQQYHIEYKPSSSWSTPVQLNWSPSGSGSHTIHCWVSGNTGYIQAY